MSVGADVLIGVGVAICVLLLSGVWTDRTYRQFSQLPGHYDITGSATRMAPRRQMAYLLPILFSVMMIGFVILTSVLPGDMQNGDPETGLWIMIATLLGAQFFVLWLLSRWARLQN